MHVKSVISCGSPSHGSRREGKRVESNVKLKSDKYKLLLYESLEREPGCRFTARLQLVETARAGGHAPDPT